MENYKIIQIKLGGADDDLFKKMEESWLSEMKLKDPSFAELQDFHYLKSVEKTLNWMIKINDQSVGLCSFNDCPEENSLEVLKLYVLKEFRFKGYGLAMLEAIEKYASNRNYYRVLTNLGNYFDGGDILLLDLGFQIIPTEDKNLPPDSIIVMEKII